MTHTIKTALAAAVCAVSALVCVPAASAGGNDQTPISHLVDCTDAFWAVTCGLEPVDPGEAHARIVAFRMRYAGADFVIDDLAGADFSGRNLTLTDFRRADLTGADFSGAWLIETDFREAVLTGADFSGARIVDADFRDAVDGPF